MGKYIEYPFDTVKVRLQAQPDHIPLQYSGPIDCFRKSFQIDGVTGLYRGISAPLLGAALETSSLFFWERMGREAVLAAGLYEKGTSLPLSALWLTGSISGAFTSLVLTPIELVKCKIQSPVASIHGTTPRAQSPLQVIKDVWHHQGLRGFWHGQVGTLIRETGGCAAWFGSKETVTDIFHQSNARAATKLKQSYDKQTPLPLWQQALAGAFAGMSYNFIFFPADTIKSRMQTVATEHTGFKRGFYAEGAALYHQHGLAGLYRGCGITVLRSAPSSAFIFMIFDGMKTHLHWN